MRFLPLTCLLMAACMICGAQTLTCTVSNPQPGIADDIVVTYIFTGDATSFTHGNFSEFDIKGGPYQYTTQSMRKAADSGFVSQQSISLSYTLRAKHTGTIHIGSGTAKTKDGQSYTSNDVSVDVVAGHTGVPSRPHRTIENYLTTNVQIDRYPFLLATGPVYVDRSLTWADSATHRAKDMDLLPIISTFTRCSVIDTLYWDNYPIILRNYLDSTHAGFQDSYQNDVPRYYFSIKDTAGLWGMLQTLHASDTRWHYLTEIVPAGSMRYDDEGNILRNASYLYAQIQLLTANTALHPEQHKNPERIAMTFIFKGGNALLFAARAKAAGYDTQQPVGDKVAHGGFITITVNKTMMLTAGNLNAMADELLHYAADHSGHFSSMNLNGQ
jgi:BatD DUF11 like domain